MTYFIGIDSSTTATKALLMDDQGGVVAIVSSAKSDVIVVGETYTVYRAKGFWSDGIR